MKVSEVAVMAGNSQIFCFSLSAPKDNDRYYIRTMMGMDASEIVSRFNRFGLYSGQPLVTQSIVDREIVLRVVLNPEWGLSEDYSTLRDHIYRGISGSRTGQITLRLLDTGIIVAEITGVITKVEVPIFSKTPEMQITINCPDAMLVSPLPQNVNTSIFQTDGTGIKGAVVDPQSTAPHGLVAQFTHTGANDIFVIKDNDPSNVSSEWELRLEYSFLSGDVLTVDTRTRTRAIYITRSATRIDMLSHMSLDSTWPLIYPGANHIWIAGLNTGSSAHADVGLDSLSHASTYWGI